MRTTRLALIATTAVAAAIALPATAQADSDYQMFASPSGNIHCHIDNTRPTPLAHCQIHDYRYAVPPELPRDEITGSPCPYGAAGGRDFRLDQGKPAYLTCTYANHDSGFSGVWPTLDYGQTRSLGPITCASEPSGMRCTDTSSGHYFRVSNDSYELG